MQELQKNMIDYFVICRRYGGAWYDFISRFNIEIRDIDFNKCKLYKILDRDFILL